jgi:mediator of replication checkpoint protein 1
MNSKPPKASSTIINSTEDPPSPTQEQSFTRLRRRRSPTTTSPPPEPAPKTAPRNAFDILQRGAATEAAKGHQRSKPAFLDEQAEESDDDNGWGFNGGNDDDDEEGLDTGYIPELLDDKEMDEEEKQRDADLAAAKFR